MEEKELEQPLVEETNDSTDVELTEDELLDSIKAEALKLQQPDESQVDETAEVIPETKTETKNEEVLDVTATTTDFVPVPLKSKNLTIEAKSMD